MDTGLQKYLVLMKTVELGSFTRAAAALNYSQSGASRMIADLERDWGITLIDRNRGGVTLTSDGLALYPYIESLCKDYFRLQSRVGEINNIQSGLIRIGTFSSVATHWLPNIIREFKKVYPGIEYEIITGYFHEIEEWILKDRVDCGFVVEPADRRLKTIPLETDPLLAILPENHPLADKDCLTLEDLCQDPFMLLEKDGKAEISNLFEARGLQPKVFYTTADDYSIMSMVEKGLGVSILSEMILRRVSYRIVKKELAPPPERRIAFAVKADAPVPLAVNKLMDYLQYRE